MEEKKVTTIKWQTVFFSVFATILVIFVIVIGYKGKDDFRNAKFEQIKISGSYSYDGGATFNTLDDTTVISPTRADSMIVVGHSNVDITDECPVYLFSAGLRIKVFVNDKQVFQRDEITMESWEFIPAMNISRTDEIRIELETDKQYLYNVNFVNFMDRIYHTSSYDLSRHMYGKNAVNIIACIAIAILGISILISRISFGRMEGYNSEGLTACGMLMLIGGLTCFINYDYITLMIHNHFLLKYVDQLSQSMIVVYATGYLKRHMIGEKAKRQSEIMVVAVVSMLSIYLVKTMIWPISYTAVDPLYVIFVVVVAILFMVELGRLYKSGRSLSRQSRMAFDSVILLVLSFIIEMIYFVLTGTFFIKVFQAALLIFSVLQYYLLLSANIDNFQKAQRANELENELTQNKIKMVISQIQPHFLYNAISTIRALCTRNPLEARNGLDYFAKYLRANMDSLGEEGCIPFAKELDHVKSYLYIEKMRFGDLLDIRYDIETTDFWCPPLTLQTMAENAVKHGLLAQKDGGSLKISTKETEEVYVIKVEDDGVGFDMTKPLDNGRTHIGIANTRQRIAGLCDGTLHVNSKIGVGTTITITIPKGKQREIG